MRPPGWGKGIGCGWGTGGEEERSPAGCDGGGVPRGEALSLLLAWSGPAGGEGEDPSLLSMGLLDLLSWMPPPVTRCYHVSTMELPLFNSSTG